MGGARWGGSLRPHTEAAAQDDARRGLAGGQSGAERCACLTLCVPGQRAISNHSNGSLVMIRSFFTEIFM